MNNRQTQGTAVVDAQSIDPVVPLPSRLPGEDAYAHGRPTSTGTIRGHHDDFLVSEVLGFEPCGEGEHTYLQVEKRGINTGWLAAQLARFCGIRARDVGYAGRKDRHATTRQWFSCWLPGREDPDWSATSIDGLAVLQTTRHSRKLKRGRHRGNAFEILVRDVPAAGVTECLQRAERIREEGFPNYFGEQRFGRGDSNLSRAASLLGDGTDSPGMSRDERGLAISAARALMFNRAVSEKVSHSWSDIGVDEEAWLPGSYRYEINPCASQPGLIPTWFDGLVRLGVKAMRRPVKVLPRDMSWRATADSVTLCFELPRGAYATSLLRELFDYRVAERR